jgi:hypothetical protein
MTVAIIMKLKVVAKDKNARAESGTSSLQRRVHCPRRLSRHHRRGAGTLWQRKYPHLPLGPSSWIAKMTLWLWDDPFRCPSAVVRVISVSVVVLDWSRHPHYIFMLAWALRYISSHFFTDVTGHDPCLRIYPIPFRFTWASSHQ